MRNLFNVVFYFASMQMFCQQHYCKNVIINTDYHAKAEEMISQNRSKANATLIIPVVFHVVYNSVIENVHDTLLIKQLDVLNRDFKRQNTDTVNTPAPFKNFSAGMDIQFCFAGSTPSATPTNGINRVFTNKTFFNAPPNYATLDSLKHTNLGGADAWNTTEYLNIWIGNVTNVSGYAAPPTNMMVSEDGVGVNYKTLGTANSSLPYNKFRTITHEAGHFFGLKHIWGDDGGTCSGTDFMADTPNQANFTPGSGTNNCNTFPLFDACTAGGNGIMFMNYMDYSNDGCRNMFTTAQVNYMNATVNCCRVGFLNTTTADCNLITGISKNASQKNSFKIFPNPAKEILNIENGLELKEIKITNLTGQEVICVKGTNSLNVNELQNGIYFIYFDGSVPQLFAKE